MIEFNSSLDTSPEVGLENYKTLVSSIYLQGSREIMEASKVVASPWCGLLQQKTPSEFTQESWIPYDS